MIETFRGDCQEDVEAVAMKWLNSQRRIRSVRICWRTERSVMPAASSGMNGDGVDWIVDVYYERSFDSD
jgi:hypothetical protein